MSGGIGSLDILNMDPMAVVEKFAQNGFAGLDNMEAAVSAARESRDRETANLAEQYLACFSTPAGQVVLKDLMERTIFNPSWLATYGQSIEQISSEGIKADAQKELVWTIISAIAQAKKGGTQT